MTVCEEVKNKTDNKCEKSPQELCDFNTLTFGRLRIPTIIPRELIEAVKGKTFTVDQFYDYHIENVGNPNNLLYALTDDSKKIHGFIWAELNALDHSLFVNTFSVNKEYWGKGKAIPRVIKFLDNIKKIYHCPRVFWCTTNEKFFIKHGFHKSRISLMEYNSN